MINSPLAASLPKTLQFQKQEKSTEINAFPVQKDKTKFAFTDNSNKIGYA